MPTSPPAADPRNPEIVYQRFQSGILLYNAVSGTTAALPLGEYLKGVLTGQNVPADLAVESSGSALLGQLTGMDLTEAFTPDAV